MDVYGIQRGGGCPGRRSCRRGMERASPYRIATGVGATVRAAEAPVREDLRRFGPLHGGGTRRTVRADDDEEKRDQRRRPRTQ